MVGQSEGGASTAGPWLPASPALLARKRWGGRPPDGIDTEQPEMDTGNLDRAGVERIPEPV